MGMGGGGGSGKVKSDINVTPLVDVVLVLLIIFLVTMPILMKDITIDIPRKSDQDVPADIMPDQVTIEMKAGGQLFMSGQAINRTELAEKLRDRLDRMREKIVFVDFDDATRYGDAVQIMDVCKGAGASKVGLKMRDENAGQPGAPGAPAAPAAPTPPATP